jgi:hypothetical protein
MDFENITQACLLVYDTLKDDPMSQELIEQIDSADGDESIVEGLRRAVIRLETVNPAVAREVREKAKGFAF